jgi:membrane protease subunit HflC
MNKAITKPSGLIIGAGAFIVFIVALLSLYTVDNTELVMVTRWGEVMRVVEEPGLHVKLPFLEKTVTLSKRQMHYTSQPTQVMTRDKKYILLDKYCQWKIADPQALFLSVRDEIGAATRLEDIIYSGLNQELARHDLIEVINENRRTIMTNVTTIVKERALEYGIEVIDIRIKRADLPKENEQNVFARMITERERIAKQYRSEGQEEAQKIRANTDKEAEIMLAEADKQALIIRGEADAKAMALFATAFNVDPEFYEFNKLISFYKDNTKPMKILITTDSKFFELMKNSR